MIDKLYKLKQTQTDQKVAYKSEILTAISEFDRQINELKVNIATTSVDRYGAISDFMILEIHKKTLKIEIKKLEVQKSILHSKLKKLNEEIVQLQKESEQFLYILQEEKKEMYKKLLVYEEEMASEFVQSKYIAN